MSALHELCLWMHYCLWFLVWNKAVSLTNEHPALHYSCDSSDWFPLSDRVSLFWGGEKLLQRRKSKTFERFHLCSYFLSIKHSQLWSCAHHLWPEEFRSRFICMQSSVAWKVTIGLFCVFLKCVVRFGECYAALVSRCSLTVDGALSLSLTWSLLPSQSNTIWLFVQNV